MSISPFDDARAHLFRLPSRHRVGTTWTIAGLLALSYLVCVLVSYRATLRNLPEGGISSEVVHLVSQPLVAPQPSTPVAAGGPPSGPLTLTLTKGDFASSANKNKHITAGRGAAHPPLEKAPHHQAPYAHRDGHGGGEFSSAHRTMPAPSLAATRPSPAPSPQNQNLAASEDQGEHVRLSAAASSQDQLRLSAAASSQDQLRLSAAASSQDQLRLSAAASSQDQLRIGYATLTGCARFEWIAAQSRVLKASGVSDVDIFVMLSKCNESGVYRSTRAEDCRDLAANAQFVQFWTDEELAERGMLRGKNDGDLSVAVNGKLSSKGKSKKVVGSAETRSLSDGSDRLRRSDVARTPASSCAPLRPNEDRQKIRISKEFTHSRYFPELNHRFWNNKTDGIYHIFRNAPVDFSDEWSDPENNPKAKLNKVHATNFRLTIFYLWMMGFMFSRYRFVAILEDDLQLSHHLHHYFQLGARCMKMDQSIAGVSSWHDNQRDILPELFVLRQNHFGGLGWMTSREMFVNVLLPFFRRDKAEWGWDTVMSFEVDKLMVLARGGKSFGGLYSFSSGGASDIGSVSGGGATS